MRTLDKYIIRSFLSNAAVCFLALLSLRILVDMFVNMDEFAKLNFSIEQTAQQIGSYYTYQTLIYLTELGGAVIVISAAFTIAFMSHSGELTAMLASGISLRRVVRPIALCAACLSLIIVLDQEFAIPRVKDKLVRNRDDVPGGKEFQVRLVSDNDNSIWYSPKFNTGTCVMNEPVVVLRDSDFNLIGTVFGSKAIPQRFDHHSAWRISDAILSRSGANWPMSPSTEQIPTEMGPIQIRQRSEQIAASEPTFSEMKVRGVVDPRYGLDIRAMELRWSPNEPLHKAELIKPIFTYRYGTAGQKSSRILCVFQADRAYWRETEGHDGFWDLQNGAAMLQSDLTPDTLVLQAAGNWVEYMSSSELGRLLSLGRIQDPHMAMLTKHIRFTDPLNIIVMLLLGLPFILSRERDIKASFALCLLTVGTFFAFMHVCRYLEIWPGITGLTAWLPILIFGPVAVVMVDAIKT